MKNHYCLLLPYSIINDMTRNLRLCLLLPLFLLALSCEAQSDAFSSGTSAYNQENYEEAIDIYQSILDSGLHSYELLFNLGMAHLKVGNVGESILYFEKAKLLKPHEAGLDDLLTVANEQVITSITHIPDFIILEKYRDLASGLSSNSWAILQISFLLLLFLVLYAVLFKEWTGFFLSRALPIILLLFSILCFVNSQFVQIRIVDSETAIVMDEEGYLYEGADDRSEVIADVSEGVKVFIIDRVGEWYKVQLEDKDIGWIPIKKVTII